MNGDDFGLDAIEWEVLIDAVSAGECTPFIGAGAGSSLFGSTREIARILAFNDADLLRANPDNLPRIAQQLRNRVGPAVPRQLMAKHLKSKAPFGKQAPDTPHLELASLNFPVWITTAYDDLVERALVAKWKDPQVRLCKWWPFSEYGKTIKVLDTNNKQPQVLENPFAEFADATTAKPLVYHLYGHFDWDETLVVSEFDYLEFLASTAQQTDRQSTEFDVGRISTRVGAAITGTSLLFLGYRLGDLDFRILLHSIKHKLSTNVRLSIAVQLQPEDAASDEVKRAVNTPIGNAQASAPEAKRQQDKLQAYAQMDLKQYFPKANVKVLFVDYETFAAQLARACNPPSLPEGV